MGNPARPDDGTASDLWPALPVADWEDTRDTLQLWTQIVGKIRLAHSPLLNHWWNVPLYVTARGLTTSLMWTRDGRGFQIDFDFVDHVLCIVVSDGSRREVRLAPRTVADFHSEVMAKLGEVGVPEPIWTTPVEIPDAIPFDEDWVHASYDRDHVARFWRILTSTALVLYEFRTTFVGKSSPVHLFWGALDLATTRFSGRTAPAHTAGAPNCGPHVMIEAYSQEVSSAGYWPGGGGEGLFYSYAYPEPDGYRDASVTPATARYDDALGEFVVPYEDVRRAADPRATLHGFLQTTYAAAADCGGWDRAALERTPPPWTHDRVALSGRLLRAARG
ncbi:MAG: DUF5996 family protein [Acidimicrobiia bacterium]